MGDEWNQKSGTSQIASTGKYGLNPSNLITLANGEALFSGEDSSGLRQLWVTDGTATGTSEIASTANMV